MKTTLRNLMVATVASSLLLTACSSGREDDQQAKITGPLHAPRNNPQLGNDGRMLPPAQDMRAPESNPGNAVGASYDMAPADDRDMTAMAPTTAAPAQKQEKGMFSWLYREEQPVVNTAPRQVPKYNQNPAAEFAETGMASYEAAAAPVADVDMAAMDQPLEPVAAMSQDEWAAPHQEIIVAEELAVMDEPFTATPQAAPAAAQGDYPSLASVPPRPERVDVIAEKDARMADMEAARTASQEQVASLEAQVEADGGWTVPDGEPVAAQSDIDAEFAALVGAETPAVEEGYGKVMTGDQYAQELAAAQQPAADAPEMVVVEQAQPWELPAGSPAEEQAPAPVEMANTAAPVTEAQSWEPVPAQVAVAEPVMQPQTEVAAVQEGQWISLQQDPAAQMAVPVEEVSVSGTPEVASVSAIPVVPVEDASGIQLTPPSTYGRAVRTLPESRYAARRQAVYMQRYARQVQADEGY